MTTTTACPHRRLNARYTGYRLRPERFGCEDCPAFWPTNEPVPRTVAAVLLLNEERQLRVLHALPEDTVEGSCAYALAVFRAVRLDRPAPCLPEHLASGHVLLAAWEREHRLAALGPFADLDAAPTVPALLRSWMGVDEDLVQAATGLARDQGLVDDGAGPVLPTARGLELVEAIL